jgi:hypothetical protein
LPFSLFLVVNPEIIFYIFYIYSSSWGRWGVVSSPNKGPAPIVVEVCFYKIIFRSVKMRFSRYQINFTIWCWYRIGGCLNILLTLIKKSGEKIRENIRNPYSTVSVWRIFSISWVQYRENDNPVFLGLLNLINLSFNDALPM